MANLEIRMEMYEAGIKHYELAEKIGISPFTLSVWLRTELTGERLERAQKAVGELKAEKKATKESEQSSTLQELISDYEGFDWNKGIVILVIDGCPHICTEQRKILIEKYKTSVVKRWTCSENIMVIIL